MELPIGHEATPEELAEIGRLIPYRVTLHPQNPKDETLELYAFCVQHSQREDPWGEPAIGWKILCGPENTKLQWRIFPAERWRSLEITNPATCFPFAARPRLNSELTRATFSIQGEEYTTATPAREDDGKMRSSPLERKWAILYAMRHAGLYPDPGSISVSE